MTYCNKHSVGTLVSVMLVLGLFIIPSVSLAQESNSVSEDRYSERDPLDDPNVRPEPAPGYWYENEDSPQNNNNQNQESPTSVGGSSGQQEGDKANSDSNGGIDENLKDGSYSENDPLNDPDMFVEPAPGYWYTGDNPVSDDQSFVGNFFSSIIATLSAPFTSLFSWFR